MLALAEHEVDDDTAFAKPGTQFADLPALTPATDDSRAKTRRGPMHEAFPLHQLSCSANNMPLPLDKSFKSKRIGPAWFRR